MPILIAGHHKREDRTRKNGIRLELILTLTFIWASSNSVYSQDKKTQNYNQVWMAYFNQTRFSRKWGTWTDLHLRTKEDFFTNFSQSVIRLGLSCYLNDDTKFTA